MSLLIRGQDSRLAFSSPDGPVVTLNKIVSSEIIVLGEILEEQFLGEDSPDFDEIGNGVHVKLAAMLWDPEVFDFFQKIVDRRARVADASGKFSMVSLLNFPSGAKRKGIVLDLSFGDLPFKLASRKAHGTTDLEAKAKRIKWVA